MPPQFQPLRLYIKQSYRVRLSVYNAKPVIIWSRGSRNNKDTPSFIATHYSKEIHFILVYILKDGMDIFIHTTNLTNKKKRKAIPPAFEKAGVLA